MKRLDYRINSRGTSQLVQSRSVQRACMSAARLVEARARQTDLSGVGGKESDKRAWRAAFRTYEARVELKRASRDRVRYGAMVVNRDKMERYFGGSSRALYKALEALNGVTVS